MAREGDPESHARRERVRIPFRLGAVSAETAANEPADGVQARVLTDFEQWSQWRRQQANRLFTWFYILNGLVFAFVFAIWVVETILRPSVRIITEHVVLALIAASAAQLGTLAWNVGRQLLHNNDFNQSTRRSN